MSRTLPRHVNNTGAFVILLLLLSILLLPFMAFAQVKFSAVCPQSHIGKNDELYVRYIVENASEVEQIIPPLFKNFSLISGPNQQSSMSIINGNVKQYIAVEFILRPQTTGNFTLPPATATVNGKTLRSNSLSIQVSNTSAGKAQGGRALSPFGTTLTDIIPALPEKQFEDYILHKGENINEKISKNLFVRVEVNKTSCYIGEPIIATYKLYTRLKSESNLTKSPSFNGFSVSEIEMPGNYSLSTEKYNGREYSVYVLRKAQLYPLQAGEVELEPIEVENHITFIKAEYANAKSDDMFYDILRDFADAAIPAEGVEKQKIILQSKPLNISVKPLPVLNRPADFRGAVGSFTLNAEVQKESITTDEAGKISLVISGSGNMQMINAPTIAWPQEIESFEPEVKEDVDKTAIPLQGKKIFSYPFTVAGRGRYTIPPVKFSYFDINTHTYKTLLTKPLIITVKQGKKNRAAASALTGKLNGHAPGAFNRFSGMLLLLAIAIIGALLAVAVFRRKRIKERVLPIAKKSAGAIETQPDAAEKETISIPKDPLMEAEDALLQNEPAVFYPALNNCLIAYLAGKLGLAEKEFSKKRLNELLDRHNVSIGTTVMLFSLMEQIDLNVYAPFSSATQMQETLEKAREVVALLDKQIVPC